MIKVGEHITLDIIGTDKEYDPSVYERVINEIAKVAKVTILNISKYKFEPQGFTILALLAESHISFHTFPCLLYTSPSPRDMRRSRMPSSA